MKKVFYAGLIITLPLLAACEGSAARNSSDPRRVSLVIDGDRIGVVPLSDHWVAWFEGREGGGVIQAIPALPIIKLKQIKAIEQVSGCTVTGAEFQHGSLQPAYLQAVVKC